MMRLGKMHNPGDVVLASLQFTDTSEVKIRPALVLFEGENNIVVLGITSHPNREGIKLTIEEGAKLESVIRLNYIFTISGAQIRKFLFKLNSIKKKLVFDELVLKLHPLTL